MNEQELRSLVTSTGRQLLSDGLVARTWGNVSARLNETDFLITPSGLDYMQTKDEDLAIYHMDTKEWEGPRKPSGEKGVHAIAYEIFPDCNFVIHTHQTYASAISVYGIEKLIMSEEERKTLGGIAQASYGLPGTKMLKNAVKKAFMTGARTVLMEKHGVVIAGKDKEDAYEKALLLEEIAKRSWQGKRYIRSRKFAKKHDDAKDMMLEIIRKEWPTADWADQDAVITWSRGGRKLLAQLDDMAQMLGRSVPVLQTDTDNPYDYEEIADQITSALATKDAILIKGHGAVVAGMNEDDTEALKILVEKAAVTALHTNACRVHRKLSIADCMIMHTVYMKKYAKLKQDS